MVENKEQQNVDYAIISIGGLQYKIKNNDEFLVNRLKNEIGDVIKIKDVLFLKRGNENIFGRPFVNGATVEAEIIAHTKGPKIIIFKKKAKKHYKKKIGHRQLLTKLKVRSITLQPQQ